MLSPNFLIFIFNGYEMNRYPCYDEGKKKVQTTVYEKDEKYNQSGVVAQFSYSDFPHMILLVLIEFHASNMKVIDCN